MAEDKREDILSRLEIVLANVAGVTHFKRNDLTVPELSPGQACVLLLDGDENTDDRAFGRNRPPNQPLIIAMLPEIYVIIHDDPETVGPELNKFRRRIKAAVLNDAPLVALAKDKDIRYEGAQTALALGRSMAGEMGLNFTIIYFDPSILEDESDTETATSTEAPTEAPTEIETASEPASEPATETASEPASEPPSEPPSEPASEPLTEVETATATEEATEAPTEPPTEVETATATGEEPTATETPTEAQSEPPTEAQSEPPTEVETATATEEASEPPTEAETATATEEASEPPTEVETATATEEISEPPTEEISEPPPEAVPQWIANGTYQSGTGNVTPGLPAGLQAGDMMLLMVECQEAAVIPTPSGWNTFTGNSYGNNPTGTVNDIQLRAFYRFWQPGDTAPTITDPGDHVSAIIALFRGVNTSAPFGPDTAPGDRVGSQGTSTQMAYSQLTTGPSDTNMLCVFMGAWAADAAGPIISSLASTSPYTNVQTRFDGGHTNGDGGGMFLVCADRVAASLNANPALTVNQNFASSAGGSAFTLAPL
jgi:hypothetical protein